MGEEIKKLKDFAEILKDNIGRAEEDSWCVLSLNVQEGVELLKMLEEVLKNT